MRTLLLFDMGLPMVIPSMMLMAFALLPVIVLETLIIERSLQVPFMRILPWATIANFISTLIGIPVTWMSMAVVSMIGSMLLGVATHLVGWSDIVASLFFTTIGSAWIPPGISYEKWVIRGAMLFLLIPYFYASWMTEYLVMRNPLAKLKYAYGSDQDDDALLEQLKVESNFYAVRRSVRNANIVSYALLVLILLASYLVGIA